MSNILYDGRTPSPKYLQLPRFLLERNLSPDAVLIYTRLYNRLRLSAQKGDAWYDSSDRLYCFYTVEELSEQLNCSPSTVKRTFCELRKAKLLLTEREQGRANRLYVLIPEEEIALSQKETADQRPAAAERPKQGKSGITRGKKAKNTPAPDSSAANNTALKGWDSL